MPVQRWALGCGREGVDRARPLSEVWTGDQIDPASPGMLGGAGPTDHVGEDSSIRVSEPRPPWGPCLPVGTLSAEGALESPYPVKPWGIPHVCRQWNTLCPQHHFQKVTRVFLVPDLEDVALLTRV